MKKFLLIFFAVSLGTFVMAQDIPVNFQCDMSVQVAEGGFDPMTDLLVIRGSFQEAAGDPDGNWQGDLFAMEDPNTDEIYTLAVPIPSSFEGTEYAFKFVISPDGWEGIPNDRLFTLTSPEVNLPKYWFSDDSVVTIVDPVTNTINFTADISAIIGIGAGGAFDETLDTLEVRGLDWDGLGTDVTGERDMVLENPFEPGIYITTLSVTSGTGYGEGDSTKFKFKARPDARFTDGGWEAGPDRWIVYQADGTVITLPIIVPAIFPLFDAIQNDVDVTFNVDMSDPVNIYNGEHIDPSTLAFVGQRGSADFLGDWTTGGTWTATDTINGEFMKVLTDMGNDIWSRTVTVPAGTQGGQYAYKFGMDYPGASNVNSGVEWMDNEMPFGVNHAFFLVDGPGIVMNNFFGTQLPVSVEKLEDLLPAQYELEQNYPNPFNPSTKIRFTIPEAGLVSMKVYNLLGQEVAILVNEEQAVGVYEVTFDATQLPSGIYFYSINAGDFSATKKMILLK